MKIVVLGSNGMAGHVVTAELQLRSEFHVVGVARSKGPYVDEILDCSNFDALESYLAASRPTVVVNCVGVLVAESARNVGNAILMNSYLPHRLSESGRKLQFRTVHISTDCVFSGRDGGYREDSKRDGDDNYARTKALGELYNDIDLTVRTSIIGPELGENGSGLLDWFFKQSSQIDGYSEAYWSGVSTLELAKAIRELIHQDISGIYHLCAEEKISKLELLKLCRDVWELSTDIRSVRGKSVDKSLLCTRTDFEYPKPKYRRMLNEMKLWMENHSCNYEHYQFLMK